MGRRTEKSQKKSKLIFLIIIIAALISITGTYAWFSSQRDVEIVGFKINVEIAENLEISLDGETWTHSINIEDMRQFYGTYVDKDTTTVAYQATKDKHRNYVPTELLPVSTVGTVEDGNLVFVSGEIEEKKLKDIVPCSEEDITVGSTILSKEGKNSKHPYLVFDMYLRNLSNLKKPGETDLLQLRAGSLATAANPNTGLEYSVRVGLVQYGNTVDLLATGEQARNIEPNGSEAVAIWEPNYRLHTQYIVNNDERITDVIQQIDTYAIKETATEIEDNTDTTDSLLYNVYTNKVEQAEDIENQDLGTLQATTLKQIDGETNMSLTPNTITKIRCYIWLEGQDPDCVNLSSLGEELIVTLRLEKPKVEGAGTDNSYAN